MNSERWSSGWARRAVVVLVVGVACVGLAACGGGDSEGSAGGDQASSSETTAGSDGGQRKAKQVAKQEPAPGTGNVQGAVFFNDEPVAGIKVMLCETFSRFVGGCSGRQHETTTEDDGVFVVADVEPGDYEGLLVSVFDTDQMQFATSGLVSAKAYTVTDGKTLFVDDTHLFRSDLAITAPPGGAQVAAEGLTFTWDAYPSASYYELDLRSEDVAQPSPVTGQRVDSTSFSPAKSVPAGSYRLVVQAFNAKGRKLAGNSDGHVFTVT